jgi:replicative DNA helicase
MAKQLAAVPDEPQQPDTRWADAVDAERAVVGAILVAGGTMQREILALVDDADFIDPFCAWVCAKLRAMVRTGHPVDVILFQNWCYRHGFTPRASSRSAMAVELHDLMANAPLAPTGCWYAAIVVENAARRRTADYGTQLTQLAFGASMAELKARIIAWSAGALAAIERTADLHDDTAVPE